MALNPAIPGHRRAMVTVAIGERYAGQWRRFAKSGWEAYASRQGYDLHVVTQPIRPAAACGERSLHWQKLLLCERPDLAAYDQLAYVDSDILINNATAPCLLATCRPGAIGAVRIDPHRPGAAGQRGQELRATHLKLLGRARRANGLTWPDIARACAQGLVPGETAADPGRPASPYVENGLAEAPEAFVNTGVITFEPARHGDFLRRVFEAYPRNAIDWEQTFLSYELVRHPDFQALDERFNRIWYLEVARAYPFLWCDGLPGEATLLHLAVNTAFQNAWFFHLAGSLKGLMDIAGTCRQDCRQTVELFDAI